MEAATGVVVDPQTLKAYKKKMQRLSMASSSESVRLPVGALVAELSLQVCKKLVKKESHLSSMQRRFFKSIDFTAPQAQISLPEKKAVIRSLSRAFWAHKKPVEKEADYLSSFNLRRKDPAAALTLVCSSMLEARVMVSQ